MKLILVSSLVLMSLAAVLADFKPEYIRAILETAQRNALQGDEPAQPEKIESRGTSLSCQIQNTGTSTSVHALRPQDIEVIGAIGDSLTAANGAKANSVLFLISEYRGVSWSIGCEAGLSDVVTFATILKYFNPSLTGCSTDTSKQNETAAQNNFAHPGDTSFDMPSQARMLVAKLLKTPDINNKWKVINFFIGGNDLCDACKDANQKPENFLKNVQDALDYFRDNLQRVIVNLVLTLDVTGIKILTGITCRNMQNSFCSCGLSDPFYDEIQRLKGRYQSDVRKMIREDGRYDNSDLFTVVAHDFMTEMTPPLDSKGKPDYSYFAPDCFHFSQKGHEAAAIELWNSFLTPNNQKATKWTIGSSIKCPSITDPYIPTNKNAKSLRSLLLKN